MVLIKFYRKIRYNQKHNFWQRSDTKFLVRPNKLKTFIKTIILQNLIKIDINQIERLKK